MCYISFELEPTVVLKKYRFINSTRAPCVVLMCIVSEGMERYKISFERLTPKRPNGRRLELRLKSLHQFSSSADI